MPTFTYCSLNIASNIVVYELSQPNHGNADLLFRFEGNLPESNEPVWLYHWLSPDGEVLLSYCRQDAYHWLRFPSLADFRISIDVKEISCYPIPGTPEETIPHLLLDQVLPRCLAHQGRLMLHASAVQLGEGLLLFIGDSGAGKSTLAGDFHQAGQPVVSDDCLWLKENQDQIVAAPTYGGLRLWDDSLQALFSSDQNTNPMAHYSSKKRVALGENNSSKMGSELPILAVILLAPPGQTPGREVRLERLPRREAFIALLKQTFQLDVTDLDRMARHAQALGRLVPRLPAYRLSMPHDYALLPLVRQKILEAVL